MAGKNPIGRLADSAISSLRDPVGAAGKVVDQAKGTAAFGRMVAEQLSRSALTKATETAGAVVGRATGRDSTSAEPSDSAPLRSVPDVNEPAHTTEPLGERADEPTKRQGDPVTDAPARRTAKKTPPAKKATAKKASPTPAKKATAKKTTAKKTAAGEPAATPNDVAKAVEAAVAEDPTKTAATPANTSAAKKAAAKQSAAKQSAAKKSAAKKTSTKKVAAEQAPTKKAAAAERSTAKKAPVKKSAKKAPPKTADQVQNIEGTDVATPAGTPGAGKGMNPDTGLQDLNQPDTEPIMDESTAKAVGSKSETLRKAAEKNPEE